MVNGRLVAAITISAALGRSVAAEPSEAARLFDEGRQLLSEDKITEACAVFDKSWALEHTVATALNLADCGERTQDYRRAILLYEEASRLAQDKHDTKRAAFAETRISLLEPKVATIEISVEPPRRRPIVITLNGVAVVGRLHVHPLPGVIEVMARDGDIAVFDTVRLAAGHTEKVVLRFPPKPDDPPPPPPPRDPNALVTAHPRSGFTVFGAGLLWGLALACWIETKSLSNQERALKDLGSTNPADTDRIEELDSSRVSFLWGGFALAAGGVAFYFLGPRDTIRVAPTVSARSGGLSLFARF